MNTKKEMQEMEKCFPSEVFLEGSRYFPEEFFNPDTSRKIFRNEVVDLENLWIEGTRAEGRWFIGSIRNDKIAKYNESKTWEEWVRFCPLYNGDGRTPETIVSRRRNERDNPVYYFLLEKETKKD